MRIIFKSAILFTFCLALDATAVSGEIPYVIPAKTPRIDSRLEARLELTPAETPVKVWVFFTDKGIFDQNDYSLTINGLIEKSRPKVVERRRNRAKKEELFDFYDIPVFRSYIDALRLDGARIMRESRWLNAVSILADRIAIKKIANLPFVSEIKPVAVSLRRPEPAPVFKEQAELPDSVINWYGGSYTQLELIKIPLLHQFGYTGEGVRIAILDAGFELGFPVFDSINLIDQYDFVDDDPIAKDESEENAIVENRHGTMVLSVIGGFLPDQLIGPAYKSDYLLARTEIADPAVEIPAEEDNWVAAAEWADDLGADIITTSLGYYDWYDYPDLDGNTAVITVAADLAVSRGISVFVSAGNTGGSLFHYITPPADGDSVIAVGSVDSTGVIASSSSFGPTYDGRIKPEIVAMGVSVYAITNTGNFARVSGTSFAAPLSAGAGALLLEVYPEWSPMELRQVLLESADRFNNPDNSYGFGLIDAFKASQLLFINPVDPILVSVGDSLIQTFSVTGLPDSIPAFSAYNLPDGAEFEDNGDRTATLRYLAVADDLGMRTIEIEADFGGGSYILDVTLTVISQSQITIGPNPFSDSMSIFIGPDDGQIQEISIHSINGEKVWDNFSDNFNMTTASVVWSGVNNSGLEVSSGVYFVVVKTEKSLRKIKVFKR